MYSNYNYFVKQYKIFNLYMHIIFSDESYSLQIQRSLTF